MTKTEAIAICLIALTIGAFVGIVAAMCGTWSARVDMAQGYSEMMTNDTAGIDSLPKSE